jgi:hypothetical protein
MHAGLPRTATTVLQTHVFPNCRTLRYVGKNSDNRAIKGAFNEGFVEQLCLKIMAGDPAGLELLQRFLPSVLQRMKLAARDKNRAEIQATSMKWARYVHIVATMLDDMPILYSDESLSESMSGLMAHLEYGDTTPLEHLHRTGLLRRVTLSVVLREPAAFLKASYYKTLEFLLGVGREPLSFDDFIGLQMVILERHRPGSRIFLCLHNELARHYRQLCEDTVVIPYTDLVDSGHVVDTLLGIRSGEPPSRVVDFPRENSSWRRPEVNDFILSAQGVPQGIGIDEYAATFPETLHRHGVDRLIAQDAAAQA